VSFLNRNRSNTSSAQSTEDTSITTVDNRVGGDDAVFGGNVTVNPGDSPIGTLAISTTDQGAVRAGLDATLEALNFASGTQEGHASLARDLTSQAFDLAQSARQSETSGAINNLVKVLGVIAALITIAYAYTHRNG